MASFQSVLLLLPLLCMFDVMQTCTQSDANLALQCQQTYIACIGTSQDINVICACFRSFDTCLHGLSSDCLGPYISIIDMYSAQCGSNTPHPTTTPTPHPTSTPTPAPRVCVDLPMVQASLFGDPHYLDIFGNVQNCYDSGEAAYVCGLYTCINVFMESQGPVSIATKIHIIDISTGFSMWIDSTNYLTTVSAKSNPIGLSLSAGTLKIPCFAEFRLSYTYCLSLSGFVTFPISGFMSTGCISSRTSPDLPQTTRSSSCSTLPSAFQAACNVDANNYPTKDYVGAFTDAVQLYNTGVRNTTTTKLGLDGKSSDGERMVPYLLLVVLAMVAFY